MQCATVKFHTNTAGRPFAREKSLRYIPLYLIMARTKKTPVREKPILHLHAFKLTPESFAALEALSSDASDYIGRKVGMGAVVRGLAVFAQQQDTGWFYDKVCPLIAEELEQGLRWGRGTKKG